MHYCWFDCETTSGDQVQGDILSISAILTDENFNIIDKFTYLGRPRKSRSYLVDSYLVNGLDPFEVDKHEYSNHSLTKKFQEKFIKWGNKGPIKFCAYNGYNFDFLLCSHHLFSNLFTWPWIFSTGNARHIDLLPILQNIDYYAPNNMAVELNSKNNKVFKLGSICKMNGFEIKDLHSSMGDTAGLMNMAKFIKNKQPELFQKSLQYINKQDVLPAIKDLDYFTFPETFFGKTRQFAGTFIVEHPAYKGYFLIFDLKHDPEKIFAQNSSLKLSEVLFSTPKKIRTIKSNRNPLIMGKEWSNKFEDEYKELGAEKLKKRANFIQKNREEIAPRVSLIAEDQFKEKQMNQTALLPEQTIFSLNPKREQKNLMDAFVVSKKMEEQVKIHSNFTGPLKNLSELVLIDEYDKEAFTQNEYKSIRKEISKRLLSTNKEPFATIPSQMKRIDDLRMDKNADKEKKATIENINEHLSKLAEDHEKYL